MGIVQIYLHTRTAKEHVTHSVLVGHLSELYVAKMEEHTCQLSREPGSPGIFSYS